MTLQKSLRLKTHVTIHKKAVTLENTALTSFVMKFWPPSCLCPINPLGLSIPRWLLAANILIEIRLLWAVFPMFSLPPFSSEMISALATSPIL